MGKLSTVKGKTGKTATNMPDKLAWVRKSIVISTMANL